MRSLKWSISHAVFVPEIDDQHKDIFEALSNVETALASGVPVSETGKLTQRLIGCIVGHFAHEERLMRAARYGSIGWHKRAHIHARRRVGQFVEQMEKGDNSAGRAMVKYLTCWLRNHTRVADRMMGAFLRNHHRSMWKVTFRGGTKPMDACPWVDVNGNAFDPRRGTGRKAGPTLS